MIFRRYLVLSFLVGTGLFYPDFSAATTLKRLPAYCYNALAALASGNLADISQLNYAEYLERKFERAGHSALNEKDFLGLRNLNPKYRSELVSRHVELFTLNQLTVIKSERWLKTIILQRLVENQIEKFIELTMASQVFDDSLKEKYSGQFSLEDPYLYAEPDTQSKLTRSLLQGHELIYNFIQNQRDSVVSPSVFINEVVKNFGKIQANLGETAYFQKLTEQTEITNSYLEYLLISFSEKISPDQFYKIVERYQLRKRHLFTKLYRANLTPFTVVIRAESWNYYGEILKMAKDQELDPMLIEQIKNLFKSDLKKLSFVAEQYHQYYAGGGSRAVNYNWGKENDRYRDVLGSVALYTGLAIQP
jgi:hypothetical protein